MRTITGDFTLPKVFPMSEGGWGVVPGPDLDTSDPVVGGVRPRPDSPLDSHTVENVK